MRKFLLTLLTCLMLAASPVFGAGVTDKSIGGLIDIVEEMALTEMWVGGGVGNVPVATTVTGTGAPVLAVSPTLETPIVQKDAIGVTPADTNGIMIRNSTAAAAGAQQWSPPLVQQAQGWKTDAVAASQKVEFMQDVRSVQGAAAPTGYWGIYSSIADAAYSATPALKVDSAGTTTINALTLTTDLSVANGGTGASTFALNGVLYGTGATAIGVTAIGAAGDIFVAGADPFVPAWSAGTGTGVPVRANTPTLITPELGAATFATSLTGTNAAGPTILNEAATSTNPTLVPNKAETDTGIGWASDTLHVVLGGANEYSFSTTVFLANDNIIQRPVLKDYGETVNAIGAVGTDTYDINLTLGNVVTCTLAGNPTFTFSNPPASGTAGSFTLIVTQDASPVIVWPGAVDWAGGTAPSLTTSGIDTFTFFTLDAGTIWYGYAAGLDMK